MGWRMTGSNRRPPACKAGALPAELILQNRIYMYYAWRRPTLAETKSQLPSALKSLTTVFEMGTGVTSSLLLPDKLLRRSEEHTSELQSRGHLVCRLLLEKKNKP